MITNVEKGLTIAAVTAEVETIDAGYKQSRKVLNSQLRFLRDCEAGQELAFATISVQASCTIGEVEAAMKSLKEQYLKRRRNLNSLLRVLSDEAKELADSKQPQLPLDEVPVDLQADALTMKS